MKQHTAMSKTLYDSRLGNLFNEFILLIVLSRDSECCLGNVMVCFHTHCNLLSLNVFISSDFEIIILGLRKLKASVIAFYFPHVTDLYEER